MKIVDMVPLLDTLGREYPNITKDKFHSLDGEALRYNPIADELTYASWGQRTKNMDNILLTQNPVIIIAHRDGTFKNSFSLPTNMYLRTTENGPRHNSVFEGLTFSDVGHVLLQVTQPCGLEF